MSESRFESVIGTNRVRLMCLAFQHLNFTNQIEDHSASGLLHPGSDQLPNHSLQSGV